MLGKTESAFRFSLQKGKKTSALLAENEEKLRFAMKESARALRAKEARGVFAEGIPALYRFSLRFLEKREGVLSSRYLKEALSEEKCTGGYADAALSLLPSFLTLAAVTLYLEKKDERYLHSVLHRSDVDFTEIFFAFSKIEKILLSEAAGIYACVDIPTRYLYHTRISRYAKDTNVSEEAAAKMTVARANAEDTHIGAVLPKRQEGGAWYFFFLFLMMASMLTVYVLFSDAGGANFLLALLALLPLYGFAKDWVSPFFAGAGERILPKLADGEAMRRTRVLVSIATFLCGEEKDRVIFDKLEDFYLTNGADNVVFAVLGDLPQSKTRVTERDEEIFRYAKARVSALREKYGAHFCLFIRERRYSRSENAYIGWERKRGGVLELCRHLRGKKTSLRSFFAEDAALSEIQYLITLDADTNLYIGAVRALLGAALHPENRPHFDRDRGCVTAGHAVIQPRMIPSLLSSSVSAFSSLTSGAAGLDPYAGASSDLYEELFDEGIYCGKGILDVDVFLDACDGFFPRERILSHDLLEGNLLRAALASDIVLSDGSPKNAISYYTRKHRWLRGDLQALPYLCRTVTSEAGLRMENPMSLLSKYKILDNLLHAAAPLSLILWLGIAFFLGGKTASVTLFFSLLPVFLRAGKTLVYGIRRRGFQTLSDALGGAFLSVVSFAFEGYLFADAAVRTLWRFFVSRRNFLNWTTASEGDRVDARSPDGYYRRFLPSVLIGAVFCCLGHGAAILLGLLWIAFPLVAFLLSLEKNENFALTEMEKETLSRYAADTFRYFRDFTNEKTHGLPPDNVQFSPTYEIAMRTSPTNIGMYLLSLLAARDMGLISSVEFFSRTEMTAQTLDGLAKWNGHLYNWYDLQTLSVLGDGFVSTVDSGNFVASLIAFCEGAKEYVGEIPAFLGIIEMLSAMVKETDFSALYDDMSRLFYVGYSVSSGKYSESRYDTFMSEARTASFLGVALLQVPPTHYFTPSRRMIGTGGIAGVASWSGTAFEYFMPTILLPRIRGSLSELALSYAYRIQKHASVKRRFFGKIYRFFGISECGYFAFDGAMRYQYRAFGVASLALDPLAKTEKIVAPYASFLMLENAPDEVISNLETMEALGVYGKYGFYEALDMEPSRVGRGYAVLHSVMAHHAGMSMLSVCNLLLDGVMRKRFLRYPHMRAARELLAERVPGTVSGLPKKCEKQVPPLPKALAEELPPAASPDEPNLFFPRADMLSNHQTKLFLSSSGHMELISGRTAIFLSDFDRFSLGGGARVYVNIDGVVFPTVPLGKRAKGFSSSFAFSVDGGVAEYRSRHQNGNVKYEIRLRLSVFPDRECTEISCTVSGDFALAYAVMYAEPILAQRATYLAHKCFSDLFLESRYFGDEGALVIHRRSRGDGKEHRVFGISAVPAMDAFDTMRDICLPKRPSEDDFAMLADRERRYRGSEGAMILPALAVRSAPVRKGGMISFYLGVATEEDELLYLLSTAEKRGGRKRRKQKQGALLQLQYTAAGLSFPADPFERYLLKRMIFGVRKKREPAGFALDRNAFWRHGISGENPMVLARFDQMEANTAARLGLLLRYFKYLCIRGLRYDFVIFYRETDGYFQTVRGQVNALIRAAGCENFVSFACGIYPIDEGRLSQDERFAFSLVASAEFDLGEPFSVSMAENEVLPTAEISVSDVSAHIVPIDEPKRCVLEKTVSGAFHTEGFLVKKPHGGAPFAHVLATAHFGTVLTEHSLGFTFARNAGMQKLTPHTADGFYEDVGERLLLRVYEKTEKSKFSDYDLCASAAFADFRFDGAEYYGMAAGIPYRVRVSTVGRFDMKKISVSLEKKGEAASVALFLCVTPCLGERKQDARFYRYQKTEKGVRIRSLADRNKRNFRMALLCADADACYTETAAFRTGGAFFDGREDIAAVGAHRKLSGAWNTDFCLLAYFSEKEYEALEARVLAGDIRAETIAPLFDRISVKSGNALFDEIQNRWSLYQTLVSRIYARSGFYQVSGAYGFRDQLQDGLSLIPVYPELTKVLILRAAAHQYEDGSAQHWWHTTEGTGIRTRCSDDFLWLPFVTAEYIEKTGDASILDLPIPYLSSPPLAKWEHERYERAEKSALREPLLQHLLRAIAYGNQLGAHGLPLIGTCDWNDGLSAVGIKGRGESVWLAFFRILVLRKMRRWVNDEKCLCAWEAEEKCLCEALRAHGFDGKWYRRGYYDDGTVLGGASREDARIDVLPQAFAAILSLDSGFDPKRARMSMDAVWEMLYDKEASLLKLLTPPFDQDEQTPGYIKGYVPGIRENGGQYTHAAVWAALGFLACGEVERGTEILFAINPAERYRDPHLADIYRIEPYVFAGDVYANPQHRGRGGWSFYTGSAAWYRKVVLETLCGYTETANGFYLRPLLSSRFPSFTLTVNVKNTRYLIDVSVADVPSLMLDGEYIAEKEKHLFSFDGNTHRAFMRVRFRE